MGLGVRGGRGNQAVNHNTSHFRILSYVTIKALPKYIKKPAAAAHAEAAPAGRRPATEQAVPAAPARRPRTEAGEAAAGESTASTEVAAAAAAADVEINIDESGWDVFEETACLLI